VFVGATPVSATYRAHDDRAERAARSHEISREGRAPSRGPTRRRTNHNGFNADQLDTNWPSGVSGTVRIVAAAQTVTGTHKGQPTWGDVPVTIVVYQGC